MKFVGGVPLERGDTHREQAASSLWPIHNSLQLLRRKCMLVILDKASYAELESVAQQTRPAGEAQSRNRGSAASRLTDTLAPYFLAASAFWSKALCSLTSMNLVSE